MPPLTHSTATISRIPTQRNDLPGMRSSSTQISFSSNQPAQEKPESGWMGKAALSGICMNKRANPPHSELENGFSCSARREAHWAAMRGTSALLPRRRPFNYLQCKLAEAFISRRQPRLPVRHLI